MAHFAVNVAGKPRRMDTRLSPVRTPVLTIPTDRLEDILCAVFFSFPRSFLRPTRLNHGLNSMTAKAFSPRITLHQGAAGI